MMEAGRCISVLNPYDWLPGYGENYVRLETTDLQLKVRVGFDGVDNSAQEKIILFKSVCAFYKGAFPGAGILGITYSVPLEANVGLSELLEFPDSEAALAWRNHFNNLRRIKHYRWIFTAENTMLEIFAEEAQIIDDKMKEIKKY